MVWVPLYASDSYSSDKQYTWGTGETINLREDGYPAFLTKNQVVATILLRDTKNAFKDGLFVILFDGDGKIEIGFDASLVIIKIF